jgi:small subunit ribosomal protein S4
MSRLTLDTKCRLCRSEGAKLFLKSARCSTKCPIDKRGAVSPGMHGMKRAKKPTDYGIQLRAKQKAKRIYVINETQFHNLFNQAKKLKGQVGTNLLTLLERRLDSVLYSSGLSASRSHAKQLISHGNVLVNGQVLSIPSYLVKVGDKISLKADDVEKSKEILRITDKDLKTPVWIEVDSQKLTAKVNKFPLVDDLPVNDIDINLIVEYYSR